jgi:hypothetical protein
VLNVVAGPYCELIPDLSKTHTLDLLQFHVEEHKFLVGCQFIEELSLVWMKAEVRDPRRIKNEPRFLQAQYA